MGSFLSWQDVVLMVGGLGFSIALVPAVRHKEKPPIATSLTTFLILALFSVAYATLGLWLACLSSVFTCLMWLILLVQKVRVR